MIRYLFFLYYTILPDISKYKFLNIEKEIKKERFAPPFLYC